MLIVPTDIVLGLLIVALMIDHWRKKHILARAAFIASCASAIYFLTGGTL